jgi:hypothetical protein
MNRACSGLRHAEEKKPMKTVKPSRPVTLSGRMIRVFPVLALWFVGCATSPIAINQASPVPTSRILAPHLLSEAQYTGILVIKRDAGFMGSACAIRVFVGAVPVADLAPSEKVEIFVPLGEHVVAATSISSFCGGGVSEAAVIISPERQKILRIAGGQSGDIHLQPSAF